MRDERQLSQNISLRETGYLSLRNRCNERFGYFLEKRTYFSHNLDVRGVHGALRGAESVPIRSPKLVSILSSIPVP